MQNVDETQQDGIEDEASSGLDDGSVSDEAIDEVEEEVADDDEHTPDPSGDTAEALRQLRSEISQLKNQNVFLQSQVQQQQQQTKKKSPFDGLDPNDPITREEAEAYYESRESERREIERENEIRMQEQIFRMANKDYDEMLVYFNDLVNNDPDLKKSVLSSANPPALAYQFAKNHPNYIKKQQKMQASSAADKVKNNLNKPKTSMQQSTGSKTSPKDVDWENASKEDFEKRIAQIKLSQR